MPRIDRALFIWSAAALAFAIVYGTEPPAPRYYPIDRVWSWEILDGPSMGWYGRMMWAALASAIAALAAALITRAPFGKLPGRLAIRFAWLAWLGLLILGGFIVVHEFRRWGVV